MKKLILAALIAVSSFANAQTTVTTELKCFSKDEIFKGLAQYKERPLMVASADTGIVYSMFTNNETMSWTLVAFDAKHTVGCVISSGNGFAIQPLKGNV